MQEACTSYYTTFELDRASSNFKFAMVTTNKYVANKNMRKQYVKVKIDINCKLGEDNSHIMGCTTTRQIFFSHNLLPGLKIFTVSIVTKELLQILKNCLLIALTTISYTSCRKMMAIHEILLKLDFAEIWARIIFSFGENQV